MIPANILSRQSTIQGSGKTCKSIVGFSSQQCKKLDEKLAPEDASKPFTTAYQSYRDGGVNHLVVGNFGEFNKGFKKIIAETAI